MKKNFFIIMFLFLVSTFSKEKELKIENKYKATFSFDNEISKCVNLNYTSIKNFKNFRVFSLEIDNVENEIGDRFIIGYFLLKDDLIYKVDLKLDDIIKSNNEVDIVKNSFVIFQNKDKKDSLNENKKGFHSYIKVYSEYVEYHSYNNNVSTGYYETFVWDLSYNLTYYSSGFGAGRDSIELKVIENNKLNTLKIDKIIKNYNYKNNINEMLAELEKYGIKELVNENPYDMKQGVYLQYLNDYAFFLSETDRYREAIPILEKVINLSPQRAVAYLNLGDCYYKEYQKNNNKSDKDKVIENYKKYVSLLKKEAKIPERVNLFLK